MLDPKRPVASTCSPIIWTGISNDFFVFGPLEGLGCHNTYILIEGQEAKTATICAVAEIQATLVSAPFFFAPFFSRYNQVQAFG